MRKLMGFLMFLCLMEADSQCTQSESIRQVGMPKCEHWICVPSSSLKRLKLSFNGGQTKSRFLVWDTPNLRYWDTPNRFLSLKQVHLDTEILQIDSILGFRMPKTCQWWVSTPISQCLVPYRYQALLNSTAKIRQQPVGHGIHTYL